MVKKYGCYLESNDDPLDNCVLDTEPDEDGERPNPQKQNHRCFDNSHYQPDWGVPQLGYF